jgi:glycosyltransferase involved in cell wall biosynthesis
MPQHSVTVAAFTPGRRAPSGRFRVRQLVPALARHGVAVTEYPARWEAYPPRRRLWRPAWLAAALASRLADLAAAQARGTDVTLIQREFVSTLATLERFTAAPRVFDVDDAIWVFRGGRAAQALARAADAVVAGNATLAERFARWNRDVTIAPTPVDTSRWTPAEPAEPAPNGRPAVIVWSGGEGGLGDLAPVEAPIAEALRRHPRAVFRVVSNRPPQCRAIPAGRLEFRAWSPAGEVAALQDAAVGIMPLADTEWNRGKCSYKALLYLACGVPAVLSPVGMNVEVLGRAECGVAARTHEEWVAALDALLADPARAAALGAAGRAMVERHYSLHAVAPIVAGVLRRVAGAPRGGAA